MNRSIHIRGAAVRLQFGIGVLALALAISACGGGSSQDQAAANTPIARTLSANADAAAGQQVFTARLCGSCHNITTVQLVGTGLAGVMTVGGPVYPAGVSYNGTLPNGQPRTEENIAAWIRSGGQGKVGLMTAHPDITDADMANLLAYLHTLQK